MYKKGHSSLLLIGNDWKQPKCMSVREWQTHGISVCTVLFVKMLKRLRKSFVCKGIESMEGPQLHCYLRVHWGRAHLVQFGGTMDIKYSIDGAPRTCLTRRVGVRFHSLFRVCVCIT